MAALVVRNRDRAVLAYLGGSNYFGPFGMIDMVHATRSPGSALKPFIYGMAMDDGLINPSTLIEDAKLRIADYAPQDFDRAFHGTVSASEALRQSYNLPAVTLLDWLGAARVAASLRGVGAAITIPGSGPATLPLALGGVGMNLWDLSALYAGLADGGMVCPLRVLQDETSPTGARADDAPVGQRYLHDIAQRAAAIRPVEPLAEAHRLQDRHIVWIPRRLGIRQHAVRHDRRLGRPRRRYAAAGRLRPRNRRPPAVPAI
ncbi:MAG: penicillin-binding transpeptidase domain-containing protein [Rhodospirillales bacterium]